MKIRIEAIGFTLMNSPPEGKGHFLDLIVDEPVALSNLLETQLHLEIGDKIVLVNGSYVLPGHLLHEGDLVQILRMIQGG
jgi:sulfur carrier protein ThiS